MTSLKSPLVWVGGKFYMRKTIVPLFPPHQTYVEPYGGAAHILFYKKPSKVEVYNDINSDLVNFFRVLRDKDQSVELKKQLDLMPYSREEYHHCKETIADEQDPIARAVKFYVMIRQGFSGAFDTGWSYSVTETCCGKAVIVSNNKSAIAMLPRLTERLTDVQIEHLPAIEVIQKYDREQTLFYLDPPYVTETRVDKLYDYEMTDSDHAELVEALLSIKGMAILSGYMHTLYQPLLDAGWTRKDKDVCLHSKKGDGTVKPRRTETLLISPNCHNAKPQQISMWA